MLERAGAQAVRELDSGRVSAAIQSLIAGGQEVGALSIRAGCTADQDTLAAQPAGLLPSNRAPPAAGHTGRKQSVTCGTSAPPLEFAMYPMFAFLCVLFASAEAIRRRRPQPQQTPVLPAARTAAPAHPRKALVTDTATARVSPAAAARETVAARPAPEKRVGAPRRGQPRLSEAQREQVHDVLELVRQYLEADSFSCTVHSEAGFVETGFRGKNGLFVVRIAAAVNPLSIGVLVRIPLVVPDEARVRMAETVTRINYGLLLGCFDFNLSERTLRFRNSMPIADGTLTHEQFRRLLYAALASVNRYDRAFNRLLYGDDLSPAEVVAEVEMAD